jgi:phosphoglycerol transferase
VNAYILDYHKYDINLIIGSNSKFDVLKKIFTSHSSKQKIYDFNYFNLDKNNEPFIVKDWWGFNDKFIYRKAKEIISEVASTSKPFIVMVMTIDMHNKMRRFDYFPTIYNNDKDSIISSNIIAFEFINWVKEQDFYEDTVLIVLGDHYFMSAELSDTKLNDKNYTITIYNVFLNTKMDISKKTRLFSTMDLAPTIIESIGFSLPENKFGLGVSLFCEE